MAPTPIGSVLSPIGPAAAQTPLGVAAECRANPSCVGISVASNSVTLMVRQRRRGLTIVTRPDEHARCALLLHATQHVCSLAPSAGGNPSVHPEPHHPPRPRQRQRAMLRLLRRQPCRCGSALSRRSAHAPPRLKLPASLPCVTVCRAPASHPQLRVNSCASQALKSLASRWQARPRLTGEAASCSAVTRLGARASLQGPAAAASRVSSRRSCSTPRRRALAGCTRTAPPPPTAPRALPPTVRGVTGPPARPAAPRVRLAMHTRHRPCPPRLSPSRPLPHRPLVLPARRHWPARDLHLHAICASLIGAVRRLLHHQQLVHRLQLLARRRHLHLLEPAPGWRPQLWHPRRRRRPPDAQLRQDGHGRSANRCACGRAGVTFQGTAAVWRQRTAPTDHCPVLPVPTLQVCPAPSTTRTRLRALRA
jgi:hypothetical protein